MHAKAKAQSAFAAHLPSLAANKRSRAWRNARHLKSRLDAADLPYMKGESHIVPLVVGEPNCCREVSNMLMDEYDVYVQPINYPTVPKGTERLRLTATAAHSIEDVDQMADILTHLWETHHGLIKAVA